MRWESGIPDLCCARAAPPARTMNVSKGRRSLLGCIPRCFEGKNKYFCCPMELSKNYIPAEVEDKWYQHWTSKRYFNSKPDKRPAFTVVIPPPNVTGVLHMGHTLNE